MEPSGTQLNGVMIGHIEVPLRLEYRIESHATGVVRRLQVRSLFGEESHDRQMTADGFGHWFHQGVPMMELMGCLDWDLWCSPIAHILPIRRLALNFGESKNTTAARIEGPTLDLFIAHYRYTHLFGSAEGHLYRVEHLESGNVADVLTDAQGLIIRYDDQFERC